MTFEGDISADRGVELTPTQVKDKPVVEWEADADSFYTLLIINPDIPSRADPYQRELNHWLVGNIPGNQMDNAEILRDYIGSGARKDTGLHRYLILLFKQPGKLEFDEQRHTDLEAIGRENFNTRKFVEKYNLGRPLAGNIFLAEYDDYVPLVYKKLGLTP